ncbi:MAG: hypothetical protein FJX03_05490 [Alphaproteobacteria bacterium]|nr:hypothetical protein [Alphaproteobacteria bacterium]
MKQILGFVVVSVLFIQVNHISALEEEIERLYEARATKGNIMTYLRSEQSREFSDNGKARKRLDQVGKDAVRNRVFRARGYSIEPNLYEMLRHYQQRR